MQGHAASMANLAHLCAYPDTDKQSGTLCSCLLIAQAATTAASSGTEEKAMRPSRAEAHIALCREVAVLT